MNVSIRQATSADWRTIQKLNIQVFEDNVKYDDALDLTWDLSPKGVAYSKKATSDPKYYCIIAETDGKAVGYLIGTERVYDYRTVRLAEIDNMGVSPAYRSKGIGKMLVDAYRKWAKAHGYDRLYVNAYSKNTRAVEFYTQCGLTPIDISLEGAI